MSDETPAPSSLAPLAMGCSLVLVASLCVGPSAWTWGRRIYGTTHRVLPAAALALEHRADAGPVAPGSGPRLPAAPPWPTARTTGHFYLRVLSAEGVSFAEPGQSCVVHVYDTDEASLRCRAAIVCRGAELYGGADHGDYACAETPGPDGLRVGRDDAPSLEDGDARLAVEDERVVLSDEDGPLGTWSVTLERPAWGSDPL